MTRAMAMAMAMAVTRAMAMGKGRAIAIAMALAMVTGCMGYTRLVDGGMMAGSETGGFVSALEPAVAAGPKFERFVVGVGAHAGPVAWYDSHQGGSLLMGFGPSIMAFIHQPEWELTGVFKEKVDGKERQRSDYRKRTVFHMGGSMGIRVTYNPWWENFVDAEIMWFPWKYVSVSLRYRHWDRADTADPECHEFALGGCGESKMFYGAGLRQGGDANLLTFSMGITWGGLDK